MEEPPVIALTLCIKDNQNQLICHTQAASLEKNQGNFFVCVWREQITLENALCFCEKNGDFRFQVFEKQELWLTFPVGASSFACGSEAYNTRKLPSASSSIWKRRTFATTMGRLKKYAYDMSISLRIDYRAALTYRDDTMNADYCIISVKFKMPSVLLPVLRSSADAERKIVCAIRVGEQQRHLYLGRPQEMSKSWGDVQRQWKMRKEEETAFPGLCAKQEEFWEDHVEHHYEMTRLSMFNGQLSSRTAAVERGNDCAGNKIQIPPVLLKTESITLFFFNLGKEHVHELCRLDLFPQDFPPPKGSGLSKDHFLRRKVTANTFVRVDYRKGIEIFGIQLETLK